MDGAIDAFRCVVLVELQTSHIRHRPAAHHNEMVVARAQQSGEQVASFAQVIKSDFS